MIERLQNRRGLLICILLAIVTFAVYLPVINYQFVNYDDDVYVVENPHVRSGLSWENIKWGFTAVHNTYWQPLTWFSYMLDCTVFGLNAGASHLINVGFHIANTILLFFVLTRMTKGVWQSAFIAGLFALHPLHVESVAWIAERRDVLSTLFWLLTMLFYVRYTERSSMGRYLVTVVAFTLGLLSKPMLVTLPFVLLLLDYWPLGRFGESRSRFLRLFLEKVPFIILSSFASIVTFSTSQEVGAVVLIPLKERIVNAICSYLIYIEKMFWPVNLAVFYPHPAGYLPDSRAVIPAIAIILITVFVIYYGRRYKYLWMGWLWYLGTLVPVIGIVQVSSQAMADRYTYVSFMGLFIIISFGVADLLRNFSYKKFIFTAAGLVLLVGCVLVTSAQLKYWKNSYVLFERALQVVENSYGAGNHEKGGVTRYLSESLINVPNSPIIYNNFGNALWQMGRLDEAIKYYRFALELDPGFSISRYNLEQSLADKGQYEEAIKQYKTYLGSDVNADVLGDKPNAVAELSNLGYALAQSGKVDEAVKYYRLALELDSNDILTHGRYALALSSLGRIDEAIEQCRIVLKAMPNDAEMHNNLGILLGAKGDLEQAAECYRRALQINPNFQTARDNLDALAKQKKGP
jgi:tetratricopeptide (TPR) repeat protein